MTIRQALETGRAFAIAPSGEITLMDEHPTLEQIQTVVGGYVQMVPNLLRPKSWKMLVHEEGLVHKLDFNPTATALCAVPGAVLVGTVVVTRYV